LHDASDAKIKRHNFAASIRVFHGFSSVYFFAAPDPRYCVSDKAEKNKRFIGEKEIGSAIGRILRRSYNLMKSQNKKQSENCFFIL
jgi:hypothetical protein